MRWRKRKDRTSHEPKIGDVRRAKRFAWRPTTMSDGETVVWLESYELKQVYEIRMGGGDIYGYSPDRIDWFDVPGSLRATEECGY